MCKIPVVLQIKLRDNLYQSFVDNTLCMKEYRKKITRESVISVIHKQGTLYRKPKSVIQKMEEIIKYTYCSQSPAFCILVRILSKKKNESTNSIIC